MVGMGRWRGAGGRVGGQVYGLGGWVVGNSRGEWWLREVGGVFFRGWTIALLEGSLRQIHCAMKRTHVGAHVSRGDPPAAA